MNKKSLLQNNMKKTAELKKQNPSLVTASMREKLAELSKVETKTPSSDDEDGNSTLSICDRSVNTKINFWKSRESSKPKGDCVSKFLQQEAAYEKGVRNRCTSLS